MEKRKGTRLYTIWIAMRQRCNNPNNSNYPNYGAKGIKVCKEWKDYNNFYNWAIANGYREDDRKLTIDRINNYKGYEPDNCRFLTLQEQQNNRTNNHFITFNGETHTISQWSKILGINVQTIFTRIRKELPINEVLSKEKIHKKEVIVGQNK